MMESYDGYNARISSIGWSRGIKVVDCKNEGTTNFHCFDSEPPWSTFARCSIGGDPSILPPSTSNKDGIGPAYLQTSE